MEEDKTIDKLLTNAWRARGKENYEQTKTLVEEARALCEPDDFMHLGRIYHVLMQIESDQDRPHQAISLEKQALEYYEKAGDQLKIAHALRHVADLQVRLGQLKDALHNYQRVLAIYRTTRAGSVGNLANALRGYAMALESAGLQDQAISIWQETRDLYQSLGLKAGVQEANQHLTQLQ